MLLVFSFTLFAIAYTSTLFCVFNAVLLSFDFLKSSDDVLLVFSFIYALLSWFSFAFSLFAFSLSLSAQSVSLDVGLNTLVSVTYNKQTINNNLKG